MRSHEGAKPCSKQASKQEVDLSSDILLTLEIISGATKKCYPRKALLTIFRAARANNHWKKQGMCHTVALPFTLKSTLFEGKTRIMETQIFHHAEI
jgi:hypothetical protein